MRNAYAWLWVLGAVLSLASIALMHQRSGTIANTSDDLNKNVEELLRVLKSVRDPASANAATPQIKEKYEKIHELSKDLISTAKSADRFGGVTKESKEKLQDSMMKFGSLIKQTQSEVDRLRTVFGLPREFWTVVRGEMLKISTVWLEVAERNGASPLGQLVRSMAAMVDEFGANRVAVVDFSGMPGAPLAEFEAKLKSKIGPNAKSIINTVYGESTIVIGPVDDFGKFVASIDMGTVTDKDAGQLLVVVGQQGAPIGAQVALDPPAPATFGEPPPEPGQPASQPSANDIGSRALASATPPEPVDPLVAARLRDELEQERREESGFPNPADPEYHKKLCDLMVDSKKWTLNDDAIDAILKIPPQDIQDKAVRQQIARNFRELAQKSSGGNDQGKAIRGLATYGGKYSVPVLIEILEDQSLHVPDELFDALASLPDPKGAEAVSQQLGNFFNHRKAVRTLLTMGEVAEDALLKAAPSDNAEVSLAAVQLLGEVGTKKSLPLLAKAGKSKNQEVRAAAKESTKAILDRSKAAAQ